MTERLKSFLETHNKLFVYDVGMDSLSIMSELIK